MGCLKECVVGFAKYILFFFNLVILIAACILIGFSAKYKAGGVSVGDGSVFTFAIVLGVIIALIAFFGCCGAIKEDSCMLTTYIVVVAILFIVQLALGILAFVTVQSGEVELHKQIDKLLEDGYHQYWDTSSSTQGFIDDLQWNQECCGFHGTTDPEVQNRTTSIPDTLINSCCSKNVTICTAAKAFKDNCSNKVFDFLQSSLKAIGIIAIIFAVVELLASIFACLVKNYRD